LLSFSLEKNILTEEGSEKCFTSTMEITAPQQIRKWLLLNMKRGVDVHIGRGCEE
jgi:hypothetical protein